MLHIVSEHIEVEKQKEEKKEEQKEEEKEGGPTEEEKNANPHQSAAVLALALISFGEEIGTDMCKRQMAYMLQYGEPMIKQTVPLALALLGMTKPDNALMDQLTKLAYDADGEVSLNAILSMGLIWSGTNNSRLAANLRSLASYNKDPNNLFMVRIAQGLSHMGKGLINCQPIHTDQFLQSNVALGGLMALFVTCTAQDKLFFGRMHTTLYYLVLSMYPRMIVTLDENLETMNVPVRVGEAVDTVAVAGQPKTIRGFTTHKSPVLINYGERAELGSEEYLPQSRVIENFVILTKNPEYKPPEDDKKEKKELKY